VVFVAYFWAMALSSDKVAELKQIIHNYLSQVFQLLTGHKCEIGEGEGDCTI